MKGLGAGIGLIGILLVAAIGFYMAFGGPGNPGYVRPAMEAKRETQELTNTISGRDSKGAPVTDSITYEVNDKGILVLTVDPNGALGQKFGLRAGDLIIDLAGIGCEQFAGSPTDAKAYMQGQFAREPWMVRRGDQKLNLPQDRNVGIDTTVATPTPTPEATSVEPTTPQPNQPRGNARNQARDLVNKIETH